MSIMEQDKYTDDVAGGPVPSGGAALPEPWFENVEVGKVTSLRCRHSLFYWSTRTPTFLLISYTSINLPTPNAHVDCLCSVFFKKLSPGSSFHDEGKVDLVEDSPEVASRHENGTASRGAASSVMA